MPGVPFSSLNFTFKTPVYGTPPHPPPASLKREDDSESPWLPGASHGGYVPAYHDGRAPVLRGNIWCRG